MLERRPGDSCGNTVGSKVSRGRVHDNNDDGSDRANPVSSLSGPAIGCVLEGECSKSQIQVKMLLIAYLQVAALEAIVFWFVGVGTLFKAHSLRPD
jgi:hypothetical protein